jgi:hypothetical protein
MHLPVARTETKLLRQQVDLEERPQGEGVLELGGEGVLELGREGVLELGGEDDIWTSE